MSENELTGMGGVPPPIHEQALYLAEQNERYRKALKQIAFHPAGPSSAVTAEMAGIAEQALCEDLK